MTERERLAEARALLERSIDIVEHAETMLSNWRAGLAWKAYKSDVRAWLAHNDEERDDD